MKRLYWYVGSYGCNKYINEAAAKQPIIMKDWTIVESHEVQCGCSAMVVVVRLCGCKHEILKVCSIVNQVYGCVPRCTLIPIDLGSPEEIEVSDEVSESVNS